jgi:tetratricopeptide (TPR) repeat protein
VASPEVAKAQALLSVNRPDAAIELLTSALAGDPSDARGWCVLGAAHLKLRNASEALDCAHQAAGLNPASDWPHRIASVAHLQRDRWELSVREAREAVRLAPGFAHGHAQLGLALSHGGFRHWRESMRSVDHAIALAPLDAEIHLLAGNAALRQHRRKRAERHYASALELDPTSTAAINNHSLARLRRGRVISAASGFGSVAASDPSNDMYRRNLDATSQSAILRALRGLLGIAIIAKFSPDAAFVALIVATLVALVYVLRARRAMTNSTWRYLIRVPLRNWRCAISAGMLVAGFCCLAAGPFVPAANAQSLAGVPLFCGISSVIATFTARIRS